MGIVTAAFSPGIAGAWNGAPVGGPLSPTYVSDHSNMRVCRFRLACSRPLPPPGAGGTALAPDRRAIMTAELVMVV